MVGIFLIVGLVNSLPIKLLDPQWVARLCQSFQSTGVTGLTGSLLLLLASHFDPEDPILQQRVSKFRRLATFITLAWLLMIPIQSYANLQLINKASADSIQQIKTIKKIRQIISYTSTEAELREATVKLPGSPRLPQQIEALPIAKANVLSSVDNNIKLAESRHQRAQSDQMQLLLLEMFKSGVYVVLLALGFAAIAKPWPTGPTLLRSLLKVKRDTNTTSRRRKSSRTSPTPAGTPGVAARPKADPPAEGQNPAG